MAIENETIWITGATSGIGLELTKCLAQAGNIVLASGRNQEVLTQLSEDFNILTLPVDVTDTDAVANLIKGLDGSVDHLDRIILNAGTCEYFELNAPDWAMMPRVMDVNFNGTLRCLEAALPLLRKHCNERGHLVVVGSQASRAAFPRAQAYGASKAAITYFMEALAADLADTSIDVTVVQPGFVDTPLTRKNNFDMPFLMSSAKAATLIIKELDKRPLHLRFPLRLSVLLALGEMAPQFWNRHVASRMRRT